MLRLSVWLMFGIILITTACAPGADSVIVPLVTLTDMPEPELIVLTRTPTTVPTAAGTATEIPLDARATPTLIKLEQNPPWLESKAYAVPFMSQSGLKYKGVETKLGCTAASIQMILDYWKTLDPENKRLSAQRLIDINTAQGTFHSGTGLSIENVVDELNQLGYRVRIYQNSDKETLLKTFHESGPQALLVKTEWVPLGANHLVVLTAYDSESDTVTINDPWYDYTVSWEWDAFDGIWGLNYSEKKDGYLVRAFFNIFPADLD